MKEIIKCDTGCGSILNNVCDVVLSFVQPDGKKVQVGHCHSCSEMMMQACRIAGFTVDERAPVDICTCWLTPLGGDS